MDINFNYYKTFYYVAEYSSMSVAADKMFTNQSNVSRIIKILEHEYGNKLFIRNRRGVTLTEEGKVLFECVKSGIKEIDKAEEMLNNSKKEMKGKVVIGISEISIRSHLIPIIREYNKTHPRVTLRVILYSSNAQNIDALMDGKVDLSITSDIIELPDKLKYTELIESRICAVAGASFSYLKNKKLSLKEVTKYPLILVSENTSLRHILKDYFDKNGIELNPRVEIASFDQINTLIGHNVGIGFIPEGFMVDYLVNNDYIFELDVNLPKTTTCLVERKDTLMSSYTKELKEMLKKYAEYNINVDY